MTTTREIQITALGFTSEMSPWAGDYADDYDWDAIRDDYNAKLAELAPEGVSWGWSESGPWCVAELAVDADEVRDAWDEIQSEQLIDFETIAAAHEIGAVELHETDISGADIAALRQEAGQAGDFEQVALCDLALSGDADARAECERVIREVQW